MNNPAAFPRPFSGTTQYAQDGMTLRDYFAAKAMQGLLSDPDWRVGTNIDDTVYAAYKAADVMLKARKEE